MDKKVNIWKGNTTRDFIDSVGLNKASGDGSDVRLSMAFFNAPYSVDINGIPFKPNGDRSITECYSFNQKRSDV